mmetsp:Transcript_7992/g.17353  ORF Transcript_7992/g.17353 Transcript_7992/m.17353 type:complete len:668 (-) Transcript_7992:3012-5015(-)
MFVECAHGIAVPILVLLLLFLLLMLFGVADLHQALLLAREEEDEMVEEIPGRRSLFVLLFCDVPQQLIEPCFVQDQICHIRSGTTAEFVGENILEDARQLGRPENMVHELPFVQHHVLLDGLFHLFQKGINDVVLVVEFALGEVQQRDKRQVDGRYVPGHFTIAVGDVELARKRLLLDVLCTAFRFTSRGNIAFINTEFRLVHGARASHSLPYFAEVVDIMGKDDTFGEERLAILALIDELKGYIFSDDVTVVHEEKDALSQLRRIFVAEVFVKLFVVLNIVPRLHAQDTIAVVALIDVVKVMEPVGPEVRLNEGADVLNGGKFEDPAEIDDGIETGGPRVPIDVTRRRHCLGLAGLLLLGENGLQGGHFVGRGAHKIRREIFDQDVVVLPLKPLEPVFELGLSQVVAAVNIELPIDHVRNIIGALVPNVIRRRIIFQKRRPREPNAVEIEDQIDGVDRPRLVPDLHLVENDLVQKLHQPLPGFGVLVADLRQLLVSVDEIVEIQLMQKVRVPILVRDELALHGEERVVLGHVLGQNDIGEKEGTFDVAVIRPRHGPVDRLVRPGDEGLVPLDVVGGVGAAVPQGVRVEDAEIFVDGPADVLNFRVDGAKFFVQLGPVPGVFGASDGGGTVDAAIGRAADVKVEVARGAVEGVVFIGADVEDEFVPI